jgi:hypothetical protein
MKCQIHVGFHANVRLDLAHVMQLQAQNVHNITQSVYGHINKMCLGTLDTSRMGKLAVMEKKTNNNYGLGNLQALPGLFSSYGGNEITSNDHVA